MFDTTLIKLIEGDHETHTLKSELRGDKCYLTLWIKDVLLLDESIFEIINNKYLINSMTFLNKGAKIIFVLSEK